MVVLQAFFAWLIRSLGKIFQALFGWSVMALFGPRPKREQTILSAAVAAAAAWPLLVLGIVFPRIASFVLALVPVSRSIPSGALRAAWSIAALAVPAGLGLLLARYAPSVERGGWWRKVAEGFPATLGVACAFLVVAIAAPARKLVALVRRRVSIHVAVVVRLEAYEELGDLVESVLGRAGLGLARAAAPFAEEAPMRLLRWIGGPLFRRQLPARLTSFRGSALSILVNPNGLAIEGPEFVVMRVRGLLTEALTFSLALQTLDPEAQKLESRLKALVGGVRSGSAAPARTADSLDRVAERLLAADVPDDDWQVLHRELLQAACAIGGREPLLMGNAVQSATRGRLLTTSPPKTARRASSV